VLNLGAVAVAMLLGAIGFAFHLFWVGAIIVLAVLLGSMLNERRGTRQGLVLDVVAAAVDEARGAGSTSK
jgi:hypothetical protein